MKRTDEKTPKLPSSRLLLFDEEFRNQGFTSLAGVDEAGRGPWAGPVVASAVVVRDVSFQSRIDDSKKLTAAAREQAYQEIFEKCVVGVGICDAGAIDELNILQATLRAMEEAVRALGLSPDCILIDGNKAPKLPHRMVPVVDGDALSFSIACASVVAKVTRDRMMEAFDEQYPHYGFQRHKGYGTPEHEAALEKHGPCRIHRKSFGPVKRLLR